MMEPRNFMMTEATGSHAAMLEAHGNNDQDQAATLFGPPFRAEKVNILLVDDRHDKLLAVETIIADLGQNIVKARSGNEALRCLLHQDFAVILLDVNMPGLDGFETAALIRQRKRSEHTPIIFITAVSDTENHVSRGYSLGAVDYLLTPVLPDVLRTKVSVFVELYKKTEEVKHQAERLRQMEARRFERQLSETSDRLEAETKRNRFFVLSINLLGIAGFDGYFKQLNPSWEKTLGYTEEELKSKPFIEFVLPADRIATAEEIEKLKTGTITQYFENRCNCRDGSWRWLGWTAAPFLEEGLIYIFARNITERKRAEEEIRLLNEELEKRVAELTETNQALEAFTYTVAHDLRSPLRAMVGFAGALLDDYGAKLDEDGRGFAKRIVESAKRMDKLIQDLLSYSRLTREKINMGAVKLERVLEDVLKQCEPEIREKQAEIQVQSPLPKVCAQESILVQVLVNLVSNGLKFVEAGVKPRVRIWAEENATSVRLWIQDNGIGIAKEHQERIFRVFERLHGQERFPGTGIGLAIVRKGVERMGGHVGLQSQPQQGSLFSVELPKPASP
jgi:PAS domain S-box-containing protein